MDKIRDLIDRVSELAHHYYVLDDPLVSDKEYDELFDSLLALEEETGQVYPDSPTQRVGGQVLDKFDRVTHEVPLYSLDKARSLEELEAWEVRNKKILDKAGYKGPLEYMVELKFDGLTLSLTYEGGYLVSAATRGNGTQGEEILPQVQTIQNIPLSIPAKEKVIAQGEGLMPLSALEKYNETAPEKLKNARNAAAGALRNLDPAITRSRHLMAYFFNIALREGRTYRTDQEIKEDIKDLGLPIHPENVLKRDLGGVLEEIQKIEAARPDLDFLIDGVVIKINDMEAREVLGFTNRFPRWALAYKFEAEETSTILEDVEWNVGRTGKLTPTAILDPVDIGGVTVGRATLNNMDDIKRKGVRIGARVLIRRSNDVIPEVLGTLGDVEGTQEVLLPKTCPACGSDIITQGVHSFCPNSLSCPPQLVRQLAHFASRNALDIAGLSDKTAALLLREGKIQSIPDIYRLEVQDLLDLEGFKEKRATKLHEAIQASKNPPLVSFIYGLGIGNVGIKAAGDLAVHFGTFQALREARLEDLVEIDDIGPITAQEILDYFQEDHIIENLNDFQALGLVPQEAKRPEDMDSPLSGKRVVITGTFPLSRSEIKEDLEARGAQVTSSVSKKTDLVFVGDAPGSKADRARELGITIWGEDQVMDLIEGGKDE